MQNLVMLRLSAIFSLLLFTSTLIILPAFSEPAASLSALAQLPVKVVTVFKDGHAFVEHEGEMPVDNAGNVVMDYLPVPVLGTFWPYSAEKQVRLKSVVASRRKVLIPRTALSIKELIAGNPDKAVEISAWQGTSDKASIMNYDAVVVGIPTRSSQELEETALPGAGEQLPLTSDLVVLKTAKGFSLLPLGRIESLTFKNKWNSQVAQEEFRNLLTLNLDWPKAKPAQSARVGLMYLQKGLRWIPAYKVNIDGNSNARISLEATLVNELTDLKDVTVHLVIGVPSFKFKDTLDPISLQETMVSLSNYGRDKMEQRLSNAIMTQMGGAAGADEGRFNDGASGSGPEVEGSAKNEDLFVYTVKHLTLRKGQRMVFPVTEITVPYRDVYTLDIPFTPPMEIRQQFHGQQAQLAKLMRAPKFEHKLRLDNKSDFPLTTAPAIIMKNDNLLAQSLMTYTARGASTDLALTTAVDLKIKKLDNEIDRTANAIKMNGYEYGRVDLSGLVAVTNYGSKTAEIEITRNILGKLDSCDHAGKMHMVNVFEDDNFAPEDNLPDWWVWFTWPDWWTRMNGVGRVQWHATLAPKQSMEFSYKWHYLWR